MQEGDTVTTGHCSCLQPIWGVMLRPVKSISICPHTINTHKHGVVFPNLEQENEAGKILGNWYNLPAIHLISPATSLSVLLGLHTLSGYLLIICTLCASHSYPNCVEGCPSYDLKPHHCSLYRWWLCFVFVDLQAKRQKTWHYLLIQLFAARVILLRWLPRCTKTNS